MSEPSASSAVPPTGRFLSVDALRGFDMFWILGADLVVKALAKILHWPALALTMEHKVWAGFAFYDLIFPLFLFIAGMSLAFSFPRRVDKQGRAAALRHLALRCALLFALGIVYNGGLAEPWPAVRLAGVLQRIALASLAVGLLMAYCRPRALYMVGAGVLLGYWALLALVPIREVTLTKEAVTAQFGTAHPPADALRAWFEAAPYVAHGGFERGRNLANHVDFLWLPGGKYQHYWDPEGILSTLPALATCILGVLAGRRMRRPDRPAPAQVRWLAGAGGAALLAGWLWHPWFPVVKDIWTSSFVLVAGGWSLLLLAAFHYLVEVRGWRRWCGPFVWIGMNPIALYLASSLVNFWGIAARLAGGSVAAALDGAAAGLGELLVASVALALMVVLAWFLHARRIFLRA